MKLANIDTTKLIEDPKKQDFEQRMIDRSPVFDLKINRVNSKKILTYLVLMYDKNSYFVKNIQSHSRKKREVAECVGFSFNKDGKLAKEIEDCLLGKNKDFNKAIIQYASLSQDIEYKQYIVLDFNYDKMLLEALTSFGKQEDDLIDKTKNKLLSLTKSIFHGEETKDLRKALYEGAEQTRLKLRPEDIVERYAEDKLVDWSPYGKDYIPEPVEFIGELPPKNYQQ